MPDPTPTPNGGANADSTFLARTQYQSDASLAAAYYAAHPDEARAAGVNLPGQQVAAPPAATPAAPSAQTAEQINQQIQQRAQNAPASAGVPTAGQEALQAPAVDPVFALAGGLQAGAAGGVMAGAKAAGESAIAMEVQDAASRLTGLATDNPYLKGIVGIVAPIALSILAKRGISAVGGGAEPSAAAATEAAPETYPQGTVLDAQGQPVTSAPAAAPEAAPAVGGEPGPGATQFPISAEDAAKQGFLYHGTKGGGSQSGGGVEGIKAEGGMTHGFFTEKPNSLYGPEYLAVKRSDLPETLAKWKDEPPSFSPNWQQDINQLSASKIHRADAQGNILGPLVSPEAGGAGGGAAPPAPPPEDFSTPGGAAQTLAEKQLAALKTARVGENVATEFGRPDIATRVPIEQTIAEGQALRHTVEMPAEPGAEQPELAAHTAAHAGVYQDESNAIRAEASRISAAQGAGQDTTADKEALANRFSAYAINYSNMAGMRSDVGRSLQILDPLKPENILATETAKLAQTVDPNDVDTLVDKLSKITYATHGDLAEMRAEATRITAGEAGGQDMTADKAALGDRWKNSVTRTPAAVGEPDKPTFAWTQPPGAWAKQWADKLAADTARLRGELNPDDVDTLVDKLSKLEPEQQAAMARYMGEAAQEGRSVGGMMKEYFYGAALSRPTTLVKKLAGDMTSMALNSPTRAIAAKIPVWWGGPKVAAGEGNAFAYGSIAAYQDALRVAGNYFKAGGSAIDMLGGGRGGEFEAPMSPEIRGSVPRGQGGLMDTGTDLLGDVVRMPSRTIGTQHEFARFVNFRGELRALALRQATHEAGLQGLTGEEAGNVIAQRTNELADNPTPELFQAAHTAANYDTFSQPLGPIAQSVSDALDKVPLGLGRAAWAFRRVPVNLAKWAMNYTPIPAVAGAPGAALYGAARAVGADGTALGGSLNSFYTDMAAGGAPAQLAIAKLGMGSAAMLAVHQAVMDGIITGGGPSDPKLYHDLVATGWKPYSFHVNGHYYSYDAFEPLSQHIGLAADYSTIMSHMPEHDVGHAAIAASMAIGRNMSRQSYVEMLANLNHLEDDIRSGKGMTESLDKFGETTLAGLIPAALRAEAVREDPVMRDTRGMFNTFLSKIPGYSHTLPPMTDALARPILAPPGFLANEVQPFKVSSDKHDPIADETLRLGASPEKAPQLLPGSGTKAPSMMTPAGPDHPNVGVPLSPWDQYHWKVLRASIKDGDGNTLEQQLTGLLHNDDYLKAPPEYQTRIWEGLFQKYGHAATLEMQQRPDLKRQMDLRAEYKAGPMPEGTDANTYLQRSHGITPMSEGGP